jgi:hypothetical protein
MANRIFSFATLIWYAISKSMDDRSEAIFRSTIEKTSFASSALVIDFSWDLLGTEAGALPQLRARLVGLWVRLNWFVW